MGSCSTDSSAGLRRQRYVSWCADPAETGGVYLQNHLTEASGLVPDLLLTPADTKGGSPHPHPQLRTHNEEAFTLSPRSHCDLLDVAPSSHGQARDGGRKGNEEDSSPEAQSALPLLPRSSPVISRRHRPVSWQGGDTDSFNPSSPVSVDQREPLPVPTLEDPGLHPSSRCVSASSDLSGEPRLRCSGQQGLAEEQRGRGLLRCHPPRSSAHVSRQRRSRGIPEFSAGLLKTSSELEKENTHFIVVDMVLEVLEGAKWTLMMDTHQHTHCQTCTHQHTHCQTCTQKHTHCQTCTQQHTHCQTCTQQHTHCQTCTQQHTHCQTYTQQHTHCQTCTHQHTHCQTCTQQHTHCQKCTHKHTHCQTCTQQHTHCQTCTQQHTHCQTCTQQHTHCQTCTQQHTHCQTCTQQHTHCQTCTQQHTHCQTSTQQHTHCQTCTQQHTHCQTCTQQHTHCQTCTQQHTHCQTVREILKHSHSDKDMHTSHRHTHSSCTHTHKHTEEEEEEAAHGEAERQPKTFSVLSTDSGFEDGAADSLTIKTDCPRNAEALAQQLVLEFKRRWLPSDGVRRGRQSLRSSLLELPGGAGVTAISSGLTEEIRLRTRMRGCLSWAPPRVQIIFTVQPNHRRGDVVAQQNFLCAGCGTGLELKYIKKLRYCEYLGRYFCDCCHGGSEAVIPARVLTHWDFSRFPVSDFSKQLLDSVWFQPLFDLSCVGKQLYGRVKELHRFKELQDQLLDIKKLLTACRLSERVRTEFEQLPAHLTEQPHLFSMDDLLRVKKGQLVSQAHAVLNSAIAHVENCQLCLARGFICEFCREKDVIFPFQTDTCRRCPACRACFHKRCFVEKKCPKCARIQSRKKRPDRSIKE